MFCRNCGKEVSITDNFCGNCAQPIKDISRVQDDSYRNKDEYKIVGYNKLAFWLSIASVILIFMAFIEEIMYLGIALGVISLVLIIFVLIKNKKNKVTNIRNLYTLAFSIVGVISNTLWLIFTIFILPNL